MRAAVLREPGPAENLRLEDVDDPTPGPGEVVVRLRAAAHRRMEEAGQFGKIILAGP